MATARKTSKYKSMCASRDHHRTFDDDDAKGFVADRGDNTRNRMKVQIAELSQREWRAQRMTTSDVQCGNSISCRALGANLTSRESERVEIDIAQAHFPRDNPFHWVLSTRGDQSHAKIVRQVSALTGCGRQCSRNSLLKYNWPM